MAHTRGYTAAVAGTQTYVDVPAHDVSHAAVVIYSDDFESGTLNGWSAVTVQNQYSIYMSSRIAGPTTAPQYYHSGNWTMNFGGVPSNTIQRVVTGLTVGTAYVFSIWYQQGDSTIANAVTLGVNGIGSATTTIPKQGTALTDGPWTQCTYRFTATATSHTITIAVVNPAATTATVGGRVDDVAVTQPAYIEHVADHTVAAGTYNPVQVNSGTMTLDESQVPYGQLDMVGSFNASADFAASVAVIDPRLNPVMQFGIGDTDLSTAVQYTRTFNLMVTGRTVDPVNGTVSIQAATMDAKLVYYSLVASVADRGAVAYESSVKAICSYVMLKAGITPTWGSTADADFTALSEMTNHVTNGSFETATTGWTGGNATLTTVTTAVTGWPINGTHSLSILPNSSSSTDSYASIPLDFTSGDTFTISSYIRLTGVQAGTPSSRARSMVIIGNVNGVAAVVAQSPIAANAAGISRLLLTYTVPANVDTLVLRLYSGTISTAANGTVFYDAVSAIDGTQYDEDGTSVVPYFDGDTVDTANYNYTWLGTARASQSLREPVPGNRGIENFLWQPGQSAWDFLETILTAVGLRLFCDELNVWRLVAADYVAPGLQVITPTKNLFDGTDTISKNATAIDGSPLFFDACVVTYNWTDNLGVAQTAYDSYSLPGGTGTVYNVEYDRPYPGAGAAKYIVSKVAGRGREFTINSEMDWSALPGRETNLTFPYAGAQVGFLSSVTWDMAADTMSVGTRGLLQTPATAWYFQPSGKTWASVAAGVPWTTGP